MATETNDSLSEVRVPIEVRPFGRSGLLYYRFAGQIRPDDLEAATQAEAPLFARLGEDDCVTGVMDMSELRTISPSLLAQMRTLRLLIDPRVCRVIVVGASPYLRALALSLGSFGHNGHEFIFRPTLADALQSIE